ncbi:hypothetical protein MANY_27670 [Mycolicibacterium anyangense]|uniref:Uncharacterized protein n=1 Tax=Mycolicibacterium anyangense TaxID=1431246 RepID=A0A6N4W624_9MYCO|nr:hypothetical protein MANY_27670 [Mycolicibacterium anyangense]
MREFQGGFSRREDPVAQRAHQSADDVTVESVPHDQGSLVPEQDSDEGIGVALARNQQYRGPHYASLK